MLREFTEDILNALAILLGEDKVHFFTSNFSSEEKIASALKNSPLVYLDFVGDEYKDEFSKKCFFEIYIIQATQSSAKQNRESTFKEQMDFLEEIDTFFYNYKFKNANSIILGKLKKEYSDMTKNGFLSIYKRSFEVILHQTQSKFY
ncbi:hypothetical protein NCR96_04155 [Helicobacter sp. 14348-15]|uniref:hypothetical protein n=1 Tax=Helicobacter colisuis TaxID=2949739 RepID=UPI00202B1BE0|nr:hypothetical protein [Helicobacter colisuis]MCL9820936.1 hypothetical protein [Helicobacter colisuis]